VGEYCCGHLAAQLVCYGTIFASGLQRVNASFQIFCWEGGSFQGYLQGVSRAVSHGFVAGGGNLQMTLVMKESGVCRLMWLQLPVDEERRRAGAAAMELPLHRQGFSAHHSVDGARRGLLPVSGDQQLRYSDVQRDVPPACCARLVRRWCRY